MKRLYLFVVCVTLVAFSASMAFAGQNGTAVPTPEKQSGTIKYQEQDLSKEFTFRGQTFVGSDYTDNADFDSVKESLETNLLQLRYDAYVFGHLLQHTKDEAFRKAYAEDFNNLMMDAISDVGTPIRGAWQRGVKSTPALGNVQSGLDDLQGQVDELAGEVATNGRYIDALWMENHGVSSITVRVEIDKLGKELRVLDGNGEEMQASVDAATLPDVDAAVLAHPSEVVALQVD